MGNLPYKLAVIFSYNSLNSSIQEPEVNGQVNARTEDETLIISQEEILKEAHQQRQLLETYKQLLISLKFHHAESLKKLPREAALQAMHEAWEFSQKRR